MDLKPKKEKIYFLNPKMRKNLLISVLAVIVIFFVWGTVPSENNPILMPASLACSEDDAFLQDGDWDIEDSYEEELVEPKKSDEEKVKSSMTVIATPQKIEKQEPDVQTTSPSEYILQDSGMRLLIRSDVEGLSLQEINYAKNEIYARHGRKFKSPELQNYFNSKSWYSGTIEAEAFNDNLLSDVEKKNAEFLRNIEFSINPNGYPLDAH